MINELFTYIIGNAYAQDLIPCADGTKADPSIGCTEAPKAIVGTQSEILGIILKTADAVVMVAVAASIAVLIYGGITYAMSIGNEDKIKTAKNVLFWGVFGLIVTVLAKSIISTVLAIITQ